MVEIRVLIAGDHPLFRKGMRTLLDSIPHMTLIGEATSGREAVEKTLALQPDIILMDLQMPEGGGMSAIRQLAAQRPDTRILVVTLFDDDESVFTALKAGARGYVLKDADEAEMIRAIWTRRTDRYSELRAELRRRGGSKVEMYFIGG